MTRDRGRDDSAGRGRSATGGARDAPAHGPEAGFGLVEAMIAALILAVGLLAIAGIALGVASQTRTAAYMTDQDLAAQQVLEVTTVGGYAAVPAGSTDTTVTVGGTTFTVTRTVTQAGPGVKRVEVEVPGLGENPPETMMTMLHLERTAPPPPSP